MYCTLSFPSLGVYIIVVDLWNAVEVIYFCGLYRYEDVVWYNKPLKEINIMIREVIRPQHTSFTIKIPISYINKEIEFIMFPLDEQEKIQDYHYNIF